MSQKDYVGMLNKKNFITIIMFLLLFSPLILNADMAEAYKNFWSTYNIYTTILTAISLIGFGVLYNEKQTEPSYKITMLFILIGLITIITAPFKQYPLGSLIGHSYQQFNSITLFIIAPAIIKITDYLKTKNNNVVEIMVVLFIISRIIHELIFPNRLTLSNDFMAFTGLFSLAIIAPTITKDFFNKLNIAKIIGAICSVLMVLLSDNRTAIAILIVIPTFIIIFNYICKKIVKKETVHNINQIIPVSLLIISTIFILLGSIFGIFSDSNFTETLWQRGIFLQSAIDGFDLKTLLIGNGWGSSSNFTLNHLWQDGVKVTKNNLLAINFDTISNNGFQHIHNELFEYLISGGIIITTLYCTIWYKISKYSKNNIITIIILSSIAVLYSTWFTFTGDIVLFIVMLALIANKVSKKQTQKSKYTNIMNVYVSFTCIILFIFNAFIYIPYLNKFNRGIPREFFYGSFYSGEKTGFTTEKYIIRQYVLGIFKKIENNEPISQKEIRYVVDSFDTLKKKAIEGNEIAIIEINMLYNKLFSIKHNNNKNSGTIKQLISREFDNWKTVVLLANDKFKNRIELASPYLEMHTILNFDQAVDDITKKLLISNPNNTVALYYRGLLLKKYKNNLGEEMLKESFKQNITRYQKVKPEIYEKYKQYLDPKYR